MHNHTRRDCRRVSASTIAKIKNENKIGRSIHAGTPAYAARAMSAHVDRLFPPSLTNSQAMTEYVATSMTDRHTMTPRRPSRTWIPLTRTSDNHCDTTQCFPTTVNEYGSVDGRCWVATMSWPVLSSHHSSC